MNWIAIALALFSATSQTEGAIPDQRPYSLPAEVKQSITALANDCDVLVFGETHGTKEVPAVVEALLASFTKLGYYALALEVPHDQQPAIAAWARGETDVIPPFFATPGEDGRGNEQVLALVRRALRPPYDWTLICFDESEHAMMQRVMERLPHGGKGTIAELASKLTPDDMIALSVQRDAMMAKYLADGRSKLRASCRVLAICGNVHARTANNAPPESPISGLWPSFAAVLKQKNPSWQIASVNVQPFSGEYFNGGKVQKVGERPLAGVEARPTPDSDWEWELNLPRVTAATFMSKPAPMDARSE